jgi:hypothetical protein
MSTTVATLISQLSVLVQENGSVSGGYDWSTGFWSITEIIEYINVISKDFVLRSQIMKLIGAVQAVAGTRQYSEMPYTMQIDRIAFNNNPTYRTTKVNLDRENPNWRTLSGVPRKYHQDMLPTKQFEMDRAPTSGMVGSGYFPVGLLGTVRFMSSGGRQVSDAGIVATQATLTSATAAFTVGDVGTLVAIAGAGPAKGPLMTTIATFLSGTQVLLNLNASFTVTNTACSIGGTPYTPTGLLGVPRYFFGQRARNGILPHGDPYAGTIRQLLSGNTNFEVLATRLMDNVSGTTDLLRVPDFCVLYIKIGVLAKMLRKEGEGQDLDRAKYCEMRYEQGVKLFLRLMTAANLPVAQPQGATNG